MAYILKNAQGEVIAASASENPGAGWEYVENNAKVYLDYLENALVKSHSFRESDIQLARVLEDLINLMIERNLIRFTDFPEAAQRRLNQRQSMRRNSQLSDLLGDSEDTL
ncbi:MAG: hypothetical protein VW395_01505 [Methylotenera sp.]